MPFLGERHQSWVNDIKQIRLRGLSFKDRLIALLFGLIMVTLGLIEFNSHWTQSIVSPHHSWLFLNTSSQNVPAPTDKNWSNEKSNSESYWIKSEMSLDNNEEFDVLQVSLSENYQIYWDGYLIGTHHHLPNAGVVQLHLLEKHHVMQGKHHVMLFIQHPKNTLFDLSKKQFLLGKEDQTRMMAVMKMFLLISALGLAGSIILLLIKEIRSIHYYPKTTRWFLAVISTYIGLSLVDTLHHQPFQWSNPSLLAIATACSLQLIFALSRHTPNLLFKSFFTIAAATYVLIFFILGNSHERLILYDVALLLTLFFFIYTTSTNRIGLLWCAVPVFPFLSLPEGIGFLVLSFPICVLLGHQLFYIKPEKSTNPEIPEPKKVIDYLLVNSKSDKKSIPLNTVTLIKAANNYSIIVVTSGETFLHDKSLRQFSGELPENFKRIHKSYLVNFDQIEQMKNKTGGGKILEMKNGDTVPVGRVYQKDLTGRFA